MKNIIANYFIMNVSNKNIEVLEKEWIYTPTGKHKKQNCRIKLPKIKLVKIAYSRPYQGIIQNVTLTKTPAGHYYIAICCKEVAKKETPKTNEMVGIDLGIKCFATMSNGEVEGNPKHYESHEKKLAKLQKSLARKEKCGKNYQKSRLKLSRQHRRIKQNREDFLHKFTSDLVWRYKTICIEDLKSKTMKENPLYAKRISDAAFTTFKTYLTYKMQDEKRQLIIIDPYYASSQICSECGHRNKAVKDTAIRQWTCEVCQFSHDRDLNASINILNEGLKGLKEGRYVIS